MKPVRTPILRRIVALGRLARRWISRREWSVRLLGLPTSRGTEAAPGIVLIQIDGLSRTQLERAIERGRMPFLRRLLRREGYRLHTHYSGLPAMTAAVQAELLYGARTVVPAFSFRDPELQKIVRMTETESASRVQRALAEQGEGLLTGGSAYCNVYSGGAAESHYCPGSMGLDNMVRSVSWPRSLLLFTWNMMSLVRTLGLLGLELCVAVTDCWRGLIAGHDFFRELKFVPSRVIVCGLLREVIAIGAEIDATRGLPIVHVNFLGYDEQSHRRGPGSAFAHWSLRQIDQSIRRISDAAFRSHRRDYQVWIYSDHGQAATTPYAIAQGESLQETVLRLTGTTGAPLVRDHAESHRPSQGRTSWIDKALVRRWAPRLGLKRLLFDAGVPIVADTGPIGHIYWPTPPTTADRDAFAERLVQTAAVPFVLAKAGEGAATVWSATGRFELPDASERLLGADHPFLHEAARDMIELCHHPFAGHLVVCGSRPDGRSISFVKENGGHAGPSIEETRAFALLPGDASLSDTGRPYLRPLDLREAVMYALGRLPKSTRARRPVRAASTSTCLRVMTYNVHTCVGLDGRLSPERIARVIAAYKPDIVALQELDVGRARTGHIDQAHQIASTLEMAFHFHPSIHVEEERYGDAILTRFPMRLVRAEPLPVGSRYSNREPRGAIWVAIEIDGREVQVCNTHLGLIAGERATQVETLLGPDWSDHPAMGQAAILCGDFNAAPWSAAYRRIVGRWRDAHVASGNRPPRPTWPSQYPLKRIDYIFIGNAFEVIDAVVPAHRLARTASDHRPLVVDLQLRPVH